jgi:hypothetical protein
MEQNKVFGDLGDLAAHYLHQLDSYYKVLSVTQLISLNQHGIKTDGAGIRAVRIFTRQTLSAISLSKLLPRPFIGSQIDSDLWDVGSIASITRNLVEGYMSLYYFGIEKVTALEAELRFVILQLHRNVEWYNIRKQEMSEAELKQFEDGIASEIDRIKKHPQLANLTGPQRRKAVKGNEIYKTKSDFERELSVCSDLRNHYRLLSNLVHPLPLSIERVDNLRGRGLGCEADVAYSLYCAGLATRYLAATTIGIAEHFSDVFLEKFKNEIQTIREHIK